MRSTMFHAGLAVLLGTAGCGYSSQPGYTDPPTTVAVEGVRVTPQVIQFAAIGATRQVVATIAPFEATDQAITWESTDPTVATVDANGLVTAKAAGFGVFVTATTHDGQHEASVNVSVVP